MRTATQEDIEKCREFLQKNDYAVVATVGPEGDPTAALIAYLPDGDWNTYFFTRKNTAKSQNLKVKPEVALAIGTGSETATVQIKGTAHELSPEEHDYWMSEFLTSHKGFYATFLRLEGYDFIGYKVVPRKIHWLRVTEEDRKEDLVEIPL